jgi:hypothetical protein
LPLWCCGTWICNPPSMVFITRMKSFTGWWCFRSNLIRWPFIPFSLLSPKTALEPKPRQLKMCFYFSASTSALELITVYMKVNLPVFSSYSSRYLQ